MIAFSPTGRILATAGEGGFKVHLWDVNSGQEIRQFEAPQGHHLAMAFAPDSRTLATGGGDSTILLWDVTGQALAGKMKQAAPLTAQQLNELCSDLAGEAAQADRAIWALALVPKQSLPLLKDALEPLPPAQAGQVAKLIADLDSERFAVRQEAAKALEQLGEAAEGALRQALQGKLPLEVQQRLQQLVEKRNKDLIRKLRAIETLEHMGTSEARQVLASLVTAAPNPRVAEMAKSAAQRLATRQK